MKALRTIGLLLIAYILAVGSVMALPDKAVHVSDEAPAVSQTSNHFDVHQQQTVQTDFSYLQVASPPLETFSVWEAAPLERHARIPLKVLPDYDEPVIGITKPPDIDSLS